MLKTKSKQTNEVIVKIHGLKTKSNISDIIKAKDKLLAIASKANKSKTNSLKRNRRSNYTELA